MIGLIKIDDQFIFLTIRNIIANVILIQIDDQYMLTSKMIIVNDWFDSDR